MSIYVRTHELTKITLLYNGQFGITAKDILSKTITVFYFGGSLRVVDTIGFFRRHFIFYFFRSPTFATTVLVYTIYQVVVLWSRPVRAPRREPLK